MPFFLFPCNFRHRESGFTKGIVNFITYLKGFLRYAWPDNGFQQLGASAVVKSHLSD